MLKAKVTRRDAAILGGFLLVVTGASAALIAKQTQSAPAASAPLVAMGVAETEADMPESIEPGPGLWMPSGVIADPAVFQPGGKPSGVRAPARGTGTRSAAAVVPDDSSRSATTDQASAPAPLPGGAMAGPMMMPASTPRGEALVYIAALAGPREGISALLVSKSTGNSRWVKPGESAFGYTLEYATTRGAVLESGGQRYVLQLGEGRPGRQGFTPQTSQRPETVVAQAGPATSPASSEEEKFYGTWAGQVQGMSITVTYNRGGTGSMRITMPNMGGMGGIGGMGGMAPPVISFTWRVSNGSLRMGINMGGMTTEQDAPYRFEDNNRVLIVTAPGGFQVRMTKQ